jgi:ribonuclease HI
MQNTALPTTICNDLDRLNRNFLWGSTNESKKMHLVGWDKVCRPKREGGLGLYATKPKNKALLAKLNWRLHDEKDSWWARTLTAKYCPNGITSSPLPIHRGGSSNWRGLKLGHEVFRNGLRWIVSNGQHVSFWNDKWVGDHILREVIHGPLSLEESSFRICDLIEGTSFWDFSKLSIGLPPPICAQIKSIYLCTLSHLEDCIVWDTVDGSFSLRKAYQIACKPSHSLDCLGSPTWLWRTLTTPRIQFFLWQCYHDSVPVRSTLVHRGINIIPSCPRCSSPIESLSHVLRDCPDSISFWNDIVPPQCSLISFNVPFIDWLRTNCISSVIHHSSHIKWQTVFSFGLWNLWLRRNQVIFKPETSLSNTPASTISFASEFFCLWGNEKNPKITQSITIKWLLPPSGWAKLNTDGASSGNPGIAGGGGVLRDCRGAWVRGFSRSIGFASSVQAELRALLDGLIMTVELNIPYLEIEMDSLVAVDLILAVHPANVFLRSIVADCRCLLEQFEGVSIKHVYREANVCADLLAKAGCDQLVEFMLFCTPPAHVLEALRFDLSVDTRTRVIRC